jgi:hypothetical protein
VDYEQFRQMVLGANLQPLRTKEAQEMFKMTRDHTSGKQIMPVFGTAPDQPQIKQPDLPPGTIDNSIRDYRTFRDRAAFLKTKTVSVQELQGFLEDIQNGNCVNKIISVDFDVGHLLHLAKALEGFEAEEMAQVGGLARWLFEEASRCKHVKTVIWGLLSKRDKLVLHKCLEGLGAEAECIRQLTS